MITLNASGGSITFEFSGNSTYLNDGTITVPVNSLALIIDESDMATFKKAASNDIFVSANIAEFGMTKDELESWYKANMVGSTGGGVDSGTVQTMIDESISGKMDTSAYTVDASVNSASTNPVQNKALYDELRVETETTLTFEGDYSTNYPSGCTTIKVEVSGTGDMQTIGFYDSNWGQIGQVVIDTIHGYIAVDNNDFEGSTYTINGNIVTISYPSITNVKYLYTGNLYTYKAVTSVSTLKDLVNGKTNQSDFTAYTANTQAVLNNKLDASAYTVDASVNSASTNPVQNQALYNVLSYIYSQLPYLSVIENGDFEGSGNTNFLYKPSVGNVQYCTIQDGVGKDNSRGIVVTNTTAGQQFDTELFVKMNQIIKLGTKFHVEFDYKANKTINGVSTQSHGQPGSYNYWDCIGTINFTDQWQHFTKTVTVTSSMGGNSNNFQTICFTLGATADAEYYFDNFVITVEQKL